MGFETYIPQRGPSSGKSTIRILRNGDLSVSPAVYEKWFGKAGYTELLYDAKAGKIGLKPRTQPTKATYKLRESPQGGLRYYVSAGRFMQAYGISVRKAKSFEARWNDKAKVIEFSVR
jgi:hypothetical protein